MSKQNKIIVILGTTASGKTTLGVKLASKYNGEIVSADSRQVYKGMDIGTGKDLNEYKSEDGKDTLYHLIDVVEPTEEFSLADYQKLANTAIADILKRGKLPIIVGGTGLYLQAIVDGYKLPNAKPDSKLRDYLEKKSVYELFSELSALNKKFAAKLNESDRKNKRRLIRYIEINKKNSKSPGRSLEPNMYKFILLGLTLPKDELHKKIYRRLIERLEKEDMVGEVERLNNEGVSWRKLESFGLEYKYIALYLQNKIEYDEMVELLFAAIKKFAKKQMTWYRRWEKQGAKIRWIESGVEVDRLVRQFMN